MGVLALLTLTLFVGGLGRPDTFQGLASTSGVVIPSSVGLDFKRGPQRSLRLSREFGQPFRELRSNLRTRTPILTYHDVIESRGSNSLWFDCSISEFKSQLDWLANRHARFITLDQLYEHLTNGTPLPAHAIALTFADNYLGFYLRGYPIVKARRIPVAMFVHTAMVGKATGRPKASWQQLDEMRRSGLVTICSQTVTHPVDLRLLTGSMLDWEMTKSKQALESKLGVAVRFIAYPNGKWDEASLDAAKRAGYVMGFTEDCRPAETGSSILAIPRYVHTKYRAAWSDAYGR